MLPPAASCTAFLPEAAIGAVEDALQAATEGAILLIMVQSLALMPPQGGMGRQSRRWLKGSALIDDLVSVE